MFSNILIYLIYIAEEINVILWGYCGFSLIIISGLYLSIYSKFFQIIKFPKIICYFLHCLKTKNNKNIDGIHPIKIFFASLGGCVGIGNITTTALAVQIGGPGVLVWMWLIAFLGMTLKYAEIFLGLKYRIKYLNEYLGGPMYFLAKAFPFFRGITYIAAIFICIYGVEIYMFTVIRDSISVNLHIHRYIVSTFLIIIILLGIKGGIHRISNITTILIPLFVTIFLIMVTYVLIININKIPDAFISIFKSAFNGHAAIGGFIGSTLLLTISKGAATASYSGDVGIGYASIIHSQARTSDIRKQSALSILGVFLDTFIICTSSILLIVVTDVWQENINSNLLIQTSLQRYFPYMNLFMPFLLFILGYSTILPYMEAGRKAAFFISPKYGIKGFIIYSTSVFIIFSYVEAREALTLMNIVGGFLMLINILGIMKLHKKIDYNF